ncbi:MAG: hypothetical protein ACYTGV_20345 [Planctomycetota bacterium]|jgi:hypothetical protein
MDAGRLARARVRPARSDEDLARAEAFLQTPRVREVAEAHPEERGCVRLCEADEELVGALLIDPSPVRIRDVEVRCARVHETAGEDGRAIFRDSGDDELFVYLIEEFLGYLWARRYPIAYAHGELALYPAHGFVPCFYHPRVYVETAAAMELPAPYRVRHLKSDDITRVQSLRERTWTPRFFAPEADVADRPAACTLLQHCAKKANELGIEEIHFPLGPGHPVARLCLELGGRAALKGASVDPILDEEMIHVVDPAWLVAALAPAFGRRIKEVGARKLRAAFNLATGKGQWRFSVEKGQVELRRLDERPASGVEIPHWALVQLLVGYRGVDEIEAEIPPKEREVLGLLLPKLWPYSMCDPDHWEKVEPPVPYGAAVRDIVTTVRLPWA